MNQAEIAKRIAGTQPSISQYLSGARASRHEKLSREFTQLKIHAERIADQIINDENRSLTMADICIFCKEVRKDDAFKEHYKKTTGEDFPEEALL